MNVGQVYDRAIWSSPSTPEFNARILTAQKWLKQCKENHPGCRTTFNPSTLPASRMLEISMTPKASLSVKLVSTQDIDIYEQGYIVLSHVWGGIDIECKTTSVNVSTYYSQGINSDELPKLFRDAVEITQALKYRYLWIDSICIIQDSLPDWQMESAKMASIFRGADITLSATNGRNCHEPCIFPLTCEPAIQFGGSSYLPRGFAIRDQNKYTSFQKALHDDLKDAIVNSRAWIFQEKILSRRILHATSTQFFWQCATRIDPEDGSTHSCTPGYLCNYEYRLNGHVSSITTFPSQSHDLILYNLWWSWVRDYTSRTLTKSADKFAAFAGAVRLYQELSGDEPVIGLWQKNFIRHLNWAASTYGLESQEWNYTQRRPTWTWMSFPHKTVTIFQSHWEFWGKNELFEQTEVVVYQAQVLHTDVHWSAEPLVSTPSGKITIRGICDKKEAKESGSCVLDPEISEETSYEVLVLLTVYATPLRQAPWRKRVVADYCLLIENTGVEDEYIRIGTRKMQRKRTRTKDSQGNYNVDADPEDFPRGVWRTITLI
ncbi:heterokaryon incompatibility protein-domain-containing protein [Phaeosphaeriaceae sp. PMI808]|nr:heterokaryon incompatibility protein-domain-containing protein [Phaeosphaeriaceae sp. PMI808]